MPLVQATSFLSYEFLPALNVAHQQGLRFGREVLFTYGPLGFAWGGYHPATFHLLLAVWATVAVATWAALWASVRRLGPAEKWPMRAVAAFAVILLIAGENQFLHDSRFFLLPVLLLFYYFVVDSRPLSAVSILLVCVLAISALVKFTYLISACIAVAAVAVDGWRYARWRTATPGLLLVGVYLLGWRIAGQQWNDLGAYMYSSLDIVGGYAESMSGSQPTEAWDVARFVGLALMLLILVGYAGRRQPLRQSMHVGTLGLLLLLVFRAGYVRHDAHEIIATGLLLPVALLYLCGMWHGGRWGVPCLLDGVPRFGGNERVGELF